MLINVKRDGHSYEDQDGSSSVVAGQYRPATTNDVGRSALRGGKPGMFFLIILVMKKRFGPAQPEGDPMSEPAA